MTVLNTVELMETAPILFVVGISCILLGISSFITLVCIPDRYEKIGNTCVVVLILSIIGIVVCGGCSDTFTVPTGKFQYEVLISDDTSFAEVIEKYDIIEQRGEIFVVEEKE